MRGTTGLGMWTSRSWGYHGQRNGGTMVMGAQSSWGYCGARGMADMEPGATRGCGHHSVRTTIRCQLPAQGAGMLAPQELGALFTNPSPPNPSSPGFHRAAQAPATSPEPGPVSSSPRGTILPSPGPALAVGRLRCHHLLQLTATALCPVLVAEVHATRGKISVRNDHP